MTGAITTDTRLVILEAALRCFRTRGVHKTTIIEIGRDAGVSRSTVYEYFPDKRAVVDAASEHALQLFYRSMARAMDRGSFPGGQAQPRRRRGDPSAAVHRTRDTLRRRRSRRCCSTGTLRRCWQNVASS